MHDKQTNSYMSSLECGCHGWREGGSQGKLQTVVQAARPTARSVGRLGALGRGSSSAPPLVGESLDACREAALGRVDVLREWEVARSVSVCPEY